LIHHERRTKRGGGKVFHASALESDANTTPGLDRLPSQEPTPEQAAQFAEECRRLLNALADDTLRAMALAKREGYTNKEIADRLELAEPTIERKLRRIRQTWEKEMGR